MVCARCAFLEREPADLAARRRDRLQEWESHPRLVDVTGIPRAGRVTRVNLPSGCFLLVSSVAVFAA